MIGYIILDVWYAIESLVSDKERKNVNIREINQFTKSKNEHEKVKPKQTGVNKHSKRLSKRDMKNLGLNYIPKNGMKYDDFKEMNELWNCYMDQQMSAWKISDLPQMFEPHHPQFDQICGTFHKSDFHGALIKVIESKNSSLNGHEGYVIMDMRNTFSILSKDNVTRMIPKKSSLFEIKWRKFKFQFLGKHFCFQPGDRSTRKSKTVALCEL